MHVNASPEQAPNNPWCQPGAVPQAKKSDLIFSFFAVAFCALAFPFASVEFVTFGILVLLFVAVIRMARVPSAVAAVLVIAAAIGTIQFSVGAAALCLMVGICSLAFLFTVLQRPYLALLPLLVSFVAAFAISGDWRSAVLTLTFLPAALFLAAATKRNEGRTERICWTVGGLLLYAACILSYLLCKNSAAMGTDIPGYLSALRNEFSEWMFGTYELLLSTLRETSAEVSSDTVQELTQSFNRETFDEIASLLFNLIPAGMIMICSVLAYGAQLLLNAQYRSAGMSSVVTPEATVFTMRWISALLYIVSLVITVFADQTSVFVTVAENVCLIFLPGLCVCAVTGIVQTLRRATGRGKAFLILLLAVMLCCNFFAAFYFLAFWGAYQCIMQALQRKLLKKTVGADQDRDSHRDDNNGDH